MGERRGPGEVKVIDRCKNHFKLAQGIFVAPDAWLKPSAELRALQILGDESSEMRAIANCHGFGSHAF